MMRETPSSIAVYLLLVGFVGALLHIVELQNPKADTMARLFAMAGLLVSVIYAYAGIRCSSLIRNHPHRLLYVLAIGGLQIVLQLSVLYFVSAQNEISLTATSEGKAVLIRCGVSAAILIYLTVNILRLSSEHRMRNQQDELVLQVDPADLPANSSADSDK